MRRQTDHKYRSKVKKSRRSLAALSLVLISSLLLAACGNETDSTGSSSQSDSSSSETGSGEPRMGGSVVVGVTQEPDFLDPYLSQSAGTKEIFYNVFEGLVKLEPDGSFSPLLAEEYERSEDGTEYTFTIREGVSFHNGDPMTVEDVVYSLERGSGKADGTAYIPQLAVIDTITAEGQVVRVKLTQADYDLLAFFTSAIIPDDYEDQGEHPVGTGPYEFVEYVPQQRVSLTKFEDYWQEGLPYIDEAEFRILTSADAAFVDLQAGRIDVFPYLTADKGEQLEEDFNLPVANSNLVQLWALNNEVEPLNNLKVRQALNLALNKDEIFEFISYGYGSILHSGMSPAMGDYYNDRIMDGEVPAMSEGNRERARELLDEAGYPDGFELTITVPSNYVVHVQTGEIIVEQLKLIGVDASLEPVDWGTWLSRVYQGRDYQTTIIALTFVYSPADVLYRYYSEDEDNFFNFRSENFDRVWNGLPSLGEEEERVEAYHELQQILFDEAASVFLQDPGLLTAVKKDLGGYTIYPQYVQDIGSLYYKED